MPADGMHVNGSEGGTGLLSPGQALNYFSLSEEGSLVRKRCLALLGLAALFGLLFSGAPTPARAQENIYERANNGTLRPARIHTAEGDRVMPFISARTLRAAAAAPSSKAPAGLAGRIAAGSDLAQTAPPSVADAQAGSAGNVVGVSRSSLG